MRGLRPPEGDAEERVGVQEGSATILFVGVIAALMLIGSFFIGAGAVMAQKAQLQATADLSALAGADAWPVSALLLSTEASGCLVARQVAEANSATLDSCIQDGFDTKVELSRQGEVLRIPVTIRARARAGPASDLTQVGTSPASRLAVPGG